MPNDRFQTTDYVGVLREIDKSDRLAGVRELDKCEREVVQLMRDIRKRNKGRATFIVEFVGTAWHVLEALPPKSVKL